MSRARFLTIAAAIALAVGAFAVALPAVFLASKGVTNNPAAEVWMREVGVVLLAIGLTAFLVRNEPASPTMRAFLFGNLLLQLGLLPIEIFAYRDGVITLASGVAPNSVLNALLAGGFLYYGLTTRSSPSEGR
jgi:hypothetical protein